MSYEKPNYDSIDPQFSIEATGDVVAGDVVELFQAEFAGSWRNPRFAGFHLVRAIVEKDSYGSDKQQHTFTLREFPNFQTLLIKGRNVYRHRCFRLPWQDESDREKYRDEKHARGAVARQDRRARRELSNQEGW
jgi:hypothetical protein